MWIEQTQEYFLIPGFEPAIIFFIELFFLNLFKFIEIIYYTKIKSVLQAFSIAIPTFCLKFKKFNSFKII